MSLINSTAIPSSGGYELEQSLRFEDSRSAYLSRTFVTPTNRKIWTFSVWFKGGNVSGSSERRIFSTATGAGGNTDNINFTTSGAIRFIADFGQLISTQVFRDPSAWYHLIYAYDSTQSTEANRLKMYVNGTQVTSFSTTTYPSLNQEIDFNSALVHDIGRNLPETTQYYDGYLADVYWIDGQAKAPADFGETGDYGEWKPIEYSGTYGTNGFYLPFKQDYTVEGFSTVVYRGAGVTGQTNYIGGVGFNPDLVWIKSRGTGTDSHQLYDSVRGVTNSLKSDATDAELARSTGLTAFNTDGFTIGKHVYNNRNTSPYVAWNWDMGTTTNPKHQISAVGNVKHSTTQNKIGATSIAFDGTGDRLDIPASDLMESDEGTIECWVYMNALVSGSQVYYHPAIYNKGNVYQALTVNSSGTVASYLYTGAVNNLESSVNISTGAWNHVAVTWNSSGRKIWINGVERGSSNISLTSMQTAGQNSTFHIGEGINDANHVSLNAYVDELRVSKIAKYSASFTPSTSAFTEDNDTRLLLHSNADNNSTLFVDSSDGGDVNNNGSIESIVAANPTYGQSIVKYTGTAGVSNATKIGHGLSAAPEMIIIKVLGQAEYWPVWHHEMHADGGFDRKMYLNDTTGVTGTDQRRVTSVSSTTFGLCEGASTGGYSEANQIGEEHIAYVFHSVTGYSKIGSYTGSGGSGKAVTTGFKPAFLMIKRTDSAQSWLMFDNARNPSNSVMLKIAAESSGAEGNPFAFLNFTSTGFTLLAGNDNMNASGGSYIYMAFADTREYAYWLDQSGNNNDWTSNNLTESDVMVDSPTNNFPTIVPAAPLTLKEGNLNVTHRSGTYWDGCHASMGASSGKWYWEIKLNATASTWASAGQRIQAGFVGNPEQWPTVFNNLAVSSQDPASQTTSSHPAYMISTWDSNFTMYGTASYSAEGVGIPANNDILNVALDLDNNKAYFGRNGVYYDNDGSTDGNPSTGANPSVDSVISSTYYPGGIIGWGGGDEGELTFNFGQDSSFGGTKTAQGNQDGNDIGDFFYTPPSGFLALCTSNLPDVAVIPSEHFNALTYSGNSSTNAITGVGFQPDFTWFKARSDTRSHSLVDSLRGFNGTSARVIQTGSSGTNAEWESAYINSLDSDGFTLSGSENYINNSSHTYVSWNWKANGSGSSNTDGTINTTSTSANVDAGFSIITHTGNGNANATIGHGLSKAPELVISKVRNAAGYIWHVFVKELGTTHLRLDVTNAAGNDWEGHEATTASVIQLAGDAGASFNQTSKNTITYAFHSVDGYSKVGSYVANGNEDGAFVYLGFRPAFLLRKKSSGTGYWIIQDNKRPGYNTSRNNSLPTNQNVLYANTSGNEVYNNEVSFLSNGFKANATDAFGNTAGATIIYLAFAETPFKYSNAR